MITQRDIELIDRYLRGILLPEEQEIFENRMKTDNEFSEQIRFMKDLKAGIRQAERKELKKKLKQIASEYEARNQEKNPSNYFFAIAAAIAMLLTTAGIVYLVSTKGDTDFADTIKNLDSLNSVSQKKITPFNIEKYLAENSPKTDNKTFTLESTGEESFGFANNNTLKLDVVLILDENYSHHYFLKEKLYLFGNFSENDMRFYNINISGKGAIVLRTESIFYEIQTDSVEVLLPLVQVQDSALIMRLEQLNKKY